MIGAIIGDIAGSRFEFHNHRSKDFEIFHKNSFFTDDTIMSLAVAKAVLEYKKNKSDLLANAVKYMQEIGRHYPNCGYGVRFFGWIYSANPKPYESFGNGAAMRVSACAFAADSREEAIEMSDRVTAVSHDHVEGIKGARAVTDAIWLARQGKSIPEIKKFICENYYNIDFSIDEIRGFYLFNETCQDTVPQALEAFFESESFEDTIRTAVSVGGDSDTLTAIACSVAEAYYGVPQFMYDFAYEYLDSRLKGLLEEFDKVYGNNVIEE